jgi:tight adherence protein C
VINPALTGLAGTCCCAVAVRGLVLLRSPSDAERRELAEIHAELQGSGRRGPTRRLLTALGVRFGPALLIRMSPARRAAVTHRLDLAGRPAGLDLQGYTELQAAMIVVGIGLAVLFALLNSWLLVPLLLIGAWLGPEVWLRRRGRLRQAQLERDLPDFIEILSITVRAGSGYRAALERVSSQLAGAPADEVERTLREMDLGSTRREAFIALRERNESQTLDNFVAAQLQAEELGVPLANALASIASDTRRAAAQAARRRAQRATPRISLITAFFLLPATLILIAVGLYIGSGVGNLPLLGG